MQTAEAIGQACGLNAQVHGGLIGIDYGEWQGLAPEEAGLYWLELVRAWYSHPERVEIPNFPLENHPFTPCPSM
jgi:broad specificity phosphatase PhoE